MIPHSNLQGIAHRPTHSLLFSEGEYPRKKSKEENFRPSLSVTFPDSLGLGYSWREGYTLAEDFPECQLWKTELPSGASTQELLACNLSMIDTFVNSWLSSPVGINLNEQSNKPKIETRQLEQLYIFREKAEILRFLEKKQFLLPLLNDAYGNIRDYFPASDLFLEVVIDPEIANERQLVIFIAIKENAEEASEALDKFDEGWWMDNMDRAQGSLCITLEFL